MLDPNPYQKWVHRKILRRQSTPADHLSSRIILQSPLNCNSTLPPSRSQPPPPSFQNHRQVILCILASRKLHWGRAGKLHKYHAQEYLKAALDWKDSKFLQVYMILWLFLRQVNAICDSTKDLKMLDKLFHLQSGYQ